MAVARITAYRPFVSRPSRAAAIRIAGFEGQLLENVRAQLTGDAMTSRFNSLRISRTAAAVLSASSTRGSVSLEGVGIPASAINGNVLPEREATTTLPKDHADGGSDAKSLASVSTVVSRRSDPPRTRI